MTQPKIRASQAVFVQVDETRTVGADLLVPEDPRGLVVFAHGAGSSRRSPRNRLIAEVLFDAHFASLLLDLLTPDESDYDAQTRKLRFDIELLTARLVRGVDWARAEHDVRDLPVGLFGASTGAAAALRAAAARPEGIRSVVSRGGRSDLADAALAEVRAPTLFIVGGADPEIEALNRASLGKLSAPRKRLAIVQGAAHLFEETGALGKVADLTREWFLETL
jgi:putative phosphoribosyl transferase